MRIARFITPLLALLVAACGASSSPSPSPSPSGAPMPSPTASAAPVTPSPAATFTLDVIPPEDPPEVRAAIPGQQVCFLVVVGEDGAASGPVTISATAEKAAILSIEPAELTPGIVGEVWVVPDASTVETVVSVTITATRGGASQQATRTIPIRPMTDERAAEAQPYADRWVAWLASEHPELGITADTAWDPTFVSTLLVVSHYAYWSEDWEMTIAWHVMIAPYDWTEVHLRHRWTESKPSLAFRIDSVTEGTAPHPVEPPEVVVR